MAMTLPIATPSTPSADNSPASDESANLPRTPLSPSNTKTLALSLPSDQSTNNGNTQTSQQNSSSGVVKRKPSRRANTAERRATHNAVERQRRETLNGRFLDLAALLPNLSQIRRPSKSSIVNSSIAHIHASRRHRLLASRELKLLKADSDALRRELNEWRDRAGLPRVEEPVRSEGFAMVLNGEVEVLATVVEDDDDGADGYDGYDDGDEYAGVAGPPMSATAADNNSEDIRSSQSTAAVQLLKNQNAFRNAPPLSIGSNNNIHLTHVIPRAIPQQHGGPMIASSTPSVSFENPAMAALYEPNPNHVLPGPFSNAQFLQQQQQGLGLGLGGHPEDDKVAVWNTQLYPVPQQHQQQQMQQQQLQAQRSLFTPPSSAHGLGNNTNGGPNSASSFSDQTFFANFQRQQQQQFAAIHHHQQQQQHMGHMYGSPDGGDDSSSSSVGSASGGRSRERSGSLNSGSGSGYGSPQHGSPLGNYEMVGAGAESEYGMPKRFGGSGGAGLQINTSVAGHGHWGRAGGDSGIGGLVKQNLAALTPPISGGGGGFAMMMM